MPSSPGTRNNILVLVLALVFAAALPACTPKPPDDAVAPALFSGRIRLEHEALLDKNQWYLPGTSLCCVGEAAVNIDSLAWQPDSLQLQLAGGSLHTLRQLPLVDFNHPATAWATLESLPQGRLQQLRLWGRLRLSWRHQGQRRDTSLPCQLNQALNQPLQLGDQYLPILHFMIDPAPWLRQQPINPVSLWHYHQ